MKLTKLHIFIIILLVLILCPTLGACSIQEGYVNRYPDTSSSSSTGSTGSSDSSGQQYSRQFSNYSKFDHALDKTTMNNNPVYTSSYNTGYSAPKNTSSQMSGAGNTATSSGSGSSKGLLAWLKSLF
jgi:RNA recognition motif-containing protein